VNLRAVLEAPPRRVAVEINASPYRLDLTGASVAAKELGCKFSINPDAHTSRGWTTSASASAWRARGG
jgi:histidinol phosphatase-like PHP family hydrolase